MQNQSATSYHPVPEKIARIVQAILQIPTPENSQPWKIVVCENVLEVYHSFERAKLATFPDDLSVLGLGMIAETLDIVCSVEGLQAQISYFLEKRSDERPWLKAEFYPVEENSVDQLASAIFLRHTDRRRYAGGSLNDPVFQEIHHEAKANQGANLYFIDKYPDEYLSLLKNADKTVLEWPELLQDLSQWVRFTDKEINRTRDGMPWRSLLRGSENWIYYLRSRLWWLATQVKWVPASLQKLETYLFDDSSELTPISFDDIAAIGCITTKSSDINDLMASGRLALRIWLLFNLRGYGFQPMTNLTSIIYPQRLGTFNLPTHLSHLVDNAYETLQRLFGFSEAELPIFCFRTGLANGEYLTNARTLRRTDHVSYKNQ